MKQFDVPIIYRSPLISAIKKKRRDADKMKKDFAPTLLNFGALRIYLARHFGFCYGVENAIEIAFRTIQENPGKKIFLLSEMIHNPQVNADLQAHGVKFLQDTSGNTLISFNELSPEDIVLIPAFGTTLEIQNKLHAAGIRTEKYNTTCPFVEKVWNRSQLIASQHYTIVIHGKPRHEETRATFSRAALHSPAVIVRNMDQATRLAGYISGEATVSQFYSEFAGQYSEGFDPAKDLQRIGVVNQTTMLASDTQAIADYLKQTMINKYGSSGDEIDGHFADTRDTLCYATNDNQNAVISMLTGKADLAIVVGGYNSSNTSHLVELCKEKLPTYFINNDENILSSSQILHFDLRAKSQIVSTDFLPARTPATIFLTSGASCPDATVESVIRKLAGFFPATKSTEQLIENFT